MNLPSKIRSVGYLMIISQVLLMGFTLYWISGQFNSEKHKLLLGLNQRYKASQELVIDSLLVKHFIAPAMGDSAVKHFNSRQSGGYFVMGDSVRINHKVDTTAVKDGNRVITISLRNEDEKRDKNEIRGKELESEMLLRSFKLIVKNVEDSSAVNIESLYGTSGKLDTVLFVNDFESRLQDDGIDVKPIWIYKTSVEGEDIGNEKMIVGGWDEMLPSVSIKNYRPYLFGKILPQIFFVLILVMLTGSAFLFAYRSLKKQTILNEMRSSFISNISHELKTPVSTMKVAVEAIRKFDLAKDKEVALEYLDMTAKEIKRLELLITRVLDNSIIEQESTIIRAESIDLAHIVRSAIASMKSLIDMSGARVEFNCGSEIKIFCDPVYMQGVITSLIDNSLKYSDGNPLIVIEIKEERESVSIIVTDNGPGIPDRYLDRVFEKFFRIPTENIHNVKGYGLGLSFAYLIVRMHKGTIGVRNNDRGCSFTIRLPRG